MKKKSHLKFLDEMVTDLKQQVLPNNIDKLLQQEKRRRRKIPRDNLFFHCAL